MTKFLKATLAWLSLPVKRAFIMALSKQESALYDRQIRLWGVAAQQRMRDSKILIVGMTALAAEVYLINQAYEVLGQFRQLSF